MKYLIDFKNTALDSDIQSYLQTNNCNVLKEWDNFDKVFLVESASVPAVDDIIERISEESNVVISPLDIITVDPYYATHSNPALNLTVTVNDTKDWWKNYSYVSTEFTNETLTINRLGQNINVYVMDSGLESNHAEFVDSKITNVYSVTGEFGDKNGHGTAIASVIVGKTCGITDANLKVVKIFDPTRSTLEHELLDALDAIINDHEDNTFSVLNCSWVIPKNEWVEHKLRILEDEGIFVLAAAGNNGTSIEDVTPASMIDVITVGAYNQSLEPCDFSNYTGSSEISVTGDNVNHGELDGWAPGEQIWAACLNGNYGYVAGTSIATGIASAILASNLTWAVDDEGKRMKTQQTYKISTAVVNSHRILFSKDNLLEFKDPKYNASKNAIASLGDKQVKGTMQVPPDEFYVSIRAGQRKGLIRLYNNLITQSIEFIDPLPENFEILQDGRLYGAPTLAQGPTGNDPYKIYNSKFRRTMNDGIVEEVSIEIYILGENFDPASLPSDDPVQITLLGICSGFPSVCSVAPSPVICSDNCSLGGVCCNTTGKTGLDCACDAGGGGIGCCFSYDTLITLADGSTKPIGLIEIGDKILSYNTDNNTTFENEVQEIITRKDRDMYRFTLENGTEIIASEDHPFYVVGKGYSSLNPNLTAQGTQGYEVLQGKLNWIKSGDTLLMSDNTEVKINSIEPIVHPDKVFTLSNKIKSYPNYFANGVLVY
jgi:Subtilase family/Hint module